MDIFCERIVPIALVAILAWILFYILRKTSLRRKRSFDQQWPPISDEEFLRRCSVGTNPRVALGVRRIIAEQLCVPYSQVYPEQSFVNDLGAD
ncbi:MAG: hypothetical protein KDB14_16760 [Planctomycetales bacterium]|nr:hypothetical protein [Planctomycetales bacterium]